MNYIVTKHFLTLVTDIEDISQSIMDVRYGAKSTSEISFDLELKRGHRMTAQAFPVPNLLTTFVPSAADTKLNGTSSSLTQVYYLLTVRGSKSILLAITIHGM